MEKKFALVCTNEAHEVERLRMFDNYDDAYFVMSKEYIREFEDTADIMGEPEDAGIDNCSARFHLCDDYGYYWQIVELI